MLTATFRYEPPGQGTAGISSQPCSSPPGSLEMGYSVSVSSSCSKYAFPVECFEGQQLIESVYMQNFPISTSSCISGENLFQAMPQNYSILVRQEIIYASRIRCCCLCAPMPRKAGVTHNMEKTWGSLESLYQHISLSSVSQFIQEKLPFLNPDTKTPGQMENCQYFLVRKAFQKHL